MMETLVLLSTCAGCKGAKVLKEAAKAEGYEVTVEVITKSDERTRKSADLAIGLPVLIRDDGAMSDDAKEWRGIAKKKREHKTNPVVEVVEDASTDNA